jgi:anti-sigma factor RsiW
MTRPPDDCESIAARLSDYVDETLTPADRDAVDRHLTGCARCREELDDAQEAVRALSGLHKMSAPQDFDRGVEQTIHRRSAGRFFGRRAFGDRVPFELLAVLAFGVALAVYALVRASATGSVDSPFQSRPPAPELAPGAQEAMPRP